MLDSRYSIYQGCLLGMAVGDAMGYTVDSRNLEQIRADYGPNGLLGYDLVNGRAEVTSYTQLAAFSANGILMGLTRNRLTGRDTPLVRYVGLAIREWSRSQTFRTGEPNFCWLSTLPVHESGRDFYFLLLTSSLLPQNKVSHGIFGK